MLSYLGKYKITIMLLVVCIAMILCAAVSPDFYLLLLVLVGLTISSLLLYFKSLYDFLFLNISFALGIAVYLSSLGQVYLFPEKIIKPVPGMFKGEIEKVLRQNDRVASLICRGDAKCKYLPHFSNTTLLMTIFKSDSTYLKAGSDIICEITLRPPRKAVLPTDFDEANYAKSLGADFLAFSHSRDLAISDQASFLESIRENLYNSIFEALSSNMHRENAAIAYALITGDKSKIPKQIKREFAVAGTAHILAVSGLHVGLIAAAIYVLLGLIRNSNIKFSVFTTLLFTYIWLTGFRVTALRAGIMATLYLYFKIRQRQVKAINIVSAVALINILMQPMIVYSIGFQMSFLAIGGIVFFYGKINSGLKAIFKIEHDDSRFVLNSLSLSLATSITLSPLIAYYFGMFSGISFFANILIVPAAMLALSLSAAGLILSFSGLGTLLIYGADLTLYLMVMINNLSIESFKFLLVESEPVYYAVAFTLLLIAILYIEKYVLKILYSMIILTAALLLFLIKEQSEKGLEILPREQLTAVEIKDKNKILYIISERRPNQFPRRDYALEQYILEQNDDIYIAVTGNSGINLCDNLKDTILFKSVELDHSSQILVEKYLDLPKRLSQIIDLKHE